MYYAALFLLLLYLVTSNHTEVQFNNKKKHVMHHFHFWVQKQEKKNW